MSKNKRKRLGYIKAENQSNFKIDKNRLKKLTPKEYKIVNITVIGDNPKKVIKIKSNNKKYIAKTAGKWYPNESIMEYLIFKIGLLLGFEMAESELIIAEGQVRFLSTYFLKNEQQITHGKELYINSKYFKDEKTVIDIEKNKKSREEFTLQITENVIKEAFPDQGEKIFSNLLKTFKKFSKQNSKKIPIFVGILSLFSLLLQPLLGKQPNFRLRRIVTFFLPTNFQILSSKTLPKNLRSSS